MFISTARWRYVDGMDDGYEVPDSAEARRGGARLRNSFLFAVGMVAPATTLVIWFGLIVRENHLNTSALVLSAIFFVVGESFFIATALLPFLVTSLLLRKRAPIAKRRLFWPGFAAGCLAMVAVYLMERDSWRHVVIAWLAAAFFTAFLVLLLGGRRALPEAT